jgi:hypothetical protein
MFPVAKLLSGGKFIELCPQPRNRRESPINALTRASRRKRGTLYCFVTVSVFEGQFFYGARTLNSDSKVSIACASLIS